MVWLAAHPVLVTTLKSLMAQTFRQRHWEGSVAAVLKKLLLRSLPQVV